MNLELSSILLVIVSLQVKHVICDGPLQTLRMVQDKSIYGRPLGLLHSSVHALGTGLVFLAAGLPLAQVAMLALVDAVIHYHVDYVKENTVKAMQWNSTQGPFWWAMTTDQALHHMTYVLLVWLAFKP